MSDRLLLDLDAFFLEHRLCGDLDGGTSNEHAWLVVHRVRLRRSHRPADARGAEEC